MSFRRQRERRAKYASVRNQDIDIGEIGGCMIRRGRKCETECIIDIFGYYFDALSVARHRLIGRAR